jgi:hypothetical protein
MLMTPTITVQNLYLGTFNVPPPALANIAEQLTFISERLTEMAADLSQLTQRVTDIETVGESVLALVAGLKAELDAAGTDQVALSALSDRLGAEAQRLSNAVVANTPAE